MVYRTDTAPGLAYVPHAEHDIFVSYRHVADTDPWMDVLCSSLKLELGKRLGRVSMFRDSAALLAGDRWRDEIERLVQSSPVFLAVLSDPYFDSKECMEELSLFLKRLKSATDTGSAPTLMPILRLPVDHPLMSRDLQPFNHLKFFDQPDAGRPARELNPQRADDPESRFFEAVVGLAFALGQHLRRAAGAVSQHLDAVYLATVGAREDKRRDNLEHDLRAHDLLPLPGHPYMWSSETLQDEMAEQLEAARLSVFVVAPDSERTSQQRLALQLDQAVRVAVRLGQPRPMVWIPADAGVNVTPDGLIARIRNVLAGDVELFDGCTVKDFKDEVFATLAGLSAPGAGAPGFAAPLAGPAVTPSPGQGAVGSSPQAGGPVAVLVEEADLDASLGLVDALVEGLGCDLRRCVMTDASPLSAQMAKAAACAACVVVWGGRDEGWLQDIVNHPALVALRSNGRLAVHLAAPLDAYKRTFRQKNLLRLTDADLLPGLRALLSAAGVLR